MMDIQIFQNKQQLDDLFKKVSIINDEEMKSHWSRYLCVLVSGFIENSLRVLIYKYTTNRSHPTITSYINNHIKNITNLNYEKLKQLLSSFSVDWRNLLDDSISDEQKDALTSIVNNRNHIVHGRSVDLTYVRLIDYYKNATDVIEYINRNCLIC